MARDLGGPGAVVIHLPAGLGARRGERVQLLLDRFRLGDDPPQRGEDTPRFVHLQGELELADFARVRPILLGRLRLRAQRVQLRGELGQHVLHAQ